MSIIEEVLPTGFNLVNLVSTTGAELLKEVGQADYILASGRLKIDASVLDAAPNLKMVQRTGVGLDSIDIDALKSRRIPLYVNQGVNSDSVAEHTLMLILATLRRLPAVHEEVKSGVWIKQGNGIRNKELKGNRRNNRNRAYR
jgi:lactate dehydrogenase-like 2-hydroxyacid dehydrogenase